MKKINSFIVLIFSIIQIGYSQNLDKGKLDKYFDALEQNNKFMGSIAVLQNGEIIYYKSVGFADIENNVKATQNSKYKIGSITKSFTTVLILKAVEQNKLTLNQTIQQWFPTVKNADKITIQHLLTHRSGIHDFTNDIDYFNWNTQAKTEKEMMEIISNGASDFNPDSKAVYSNSNFVLLSYILEKCFVKSYSDLLQELIIQPIGLKNTYVFGKINPNQNECKSYSFNDSWKSENETHYSIPLGAGAIISTPIELTKFTDALFNGKLLSNKSLELMKSIKDGYGMGLFQIPFDNKIGYGHGGKIDGFSAVYSYFEDKKISYSLTSNGANMNINDVSIAVLSAVYNKPYEIPVFTNFSLSSNDLDKYLGIYASSQIPLKITISKNGNNLIAQATGQSAFPLDATDIDKFKFDQAGIKLEFNPNSKTMILLQGGGKFNFTKEKLLNI
jgi:D-alanyl-D-alanine carboxypeptidase